MAKKLAQIIDNHFELKKDNIVYIDGDYTKFHVVKFFGNILSTYDETSTLREDWNYYNSIHGEDFIRLLDGFMADYNPIENYDRYEDTNVTFDKGQQTDQIISASKTAHTENKVSAFDTEGYSNSSKIDNTQDGFTDSSVNGSREDKTDTTSHIHGNIGVTTNAQMLSGEALIRYNNLVDKYIDRWIQSVIVGYDEGYVDTTPSYDEYATKAELNEVKNDVNDLEDSVDSITSSVNTLGQTVAAATADITTLYSQTDNLRTDLNGVDDIVQSTVADVEELQTEAENLDTRVTALENAGFSGFELLWENPDPTQNMSPQTIPVDTKNYTMFMAIVRRKEDNANYSDYWIEKGNQTSCMAIYGGRIVFRNLTVSDNALTLANAVIYETYGNESTNQSYMIPVRLYGVY